MYTLVCLHVEDRSQSWVLSSTTLFLRLSIAVINQHDQMQCRQEIFIPSYILYSPPPKIVKAGTQRRNLEEGSEAEAMENTAYSLLA